MKWFHYFCAVVRPPLASRHKKVIIYTKANNTFFWASVFNDKNNQLLRNWSFPWLRTNAIADVAGDDFEPGEVLLGGGLDEPANQEGQ